MHRLAERFFSGTLPSVLLNRQTKLIAPLRVIQEIQKHTVNPQNRDSAIVASWIVQSYRERGLMEIRGEKEDPFADSLFLSLFQRFRTQANLALLTQDIDLSQEIMGLNDSKAVLSRYRVDVFRLSPVGLCPFPLSRSKREVESPKTSKKTERNQRPSPSKPLFKPSVLRVIEEAVILPMTEVPSAGNILVGTGNRQIRLGPILARGGEGTIFATSSPDSVAKIYHRERLSMDRKRKLELMVENRIVEPCLCWPESILKNRHQEFVGYLMPKAMGAPVQQRLFIRPIFQRTYPLWNRTNLLRFTLGVLKKIKILNDHNVIIGDINPNNILTDHETSFFVDTDSYQLEGYPCEVGTINFTAPEIQRKAFPTFLRTQEHENFAVATLVFMLMLPGKPPYSHQGGGDPLENIIKKEFSYPLQNQSNRKTPEGPWRYIWSNLPFRLKEALYKCFREGQRPSVSDWIDHIEHYLHLITTTPPTIVPTLFPSHLKPVSNYAKSKYSIEE